MWKRTVTLTWTNNKNNNSQAGAWVIYKQAGSGDVTYLATYGNKDTSNPSYTIPSSELEYDKSYKFYVSFIPDSWYSDKSQSKPASNISASTSSITVSRTFPITLKATPRNNDVLLTWTYNKAPSVDVFNKTPTFYIERYDAASREWVVKETQSVTDASKMESTYVDNDIQNNCLTYQYRIRFAAMDKTYYSNTSEGGILGASNITDLTVSKGTYPSVVKLSWTVTQTGTDETKFIVRRRVVGQNEWSSIYSVSGTSKNYFYEDNTVAAGSYYEYKVSCYVPCSDQDKLSNEFSDYGFSMTTGTISGRIGYGTGMAVQGAKVKLIKGSDSDDQNQQFYSAYCDGEGAGITVPVDTITSTRGCLNTSIFQNHPFTLGMWVMPDEKTNFTKTVVLAEFYTSDGKVPLSLDVKNGKAYAYTSGGPRPTGIDFVANQWQYVTLSYDGANSYTVKVFRDGEKKGEVTSVNETNLFQAAKYPLTLCIGASLGYESTFCGNVDEVRVWDKQLTDDEILTTYDHIIPGSTPNLKLYWPLDEGINMVFDVSKTGGVPNENHGTMKLGTTSSTTFPNDDIFSLYAMTDSIGNYTVRGIPFSGEGINYIVQPILGVHEFSPEKSTRFISANSLVHSGVDFTDVSSFKVTGTVYYSGTDYPVQGCNFYVDGSICAKDGKIIESDENGEYEISVPIGDHFIEVRKNGHVFEGNGRYPQDPYGAGVYYTFQNEMSNLEFHDSTLVVFAGKVVGGNVEGDKPLGFGQSVNNIGTVSLTMSPMDDMYRLNIKDQTNGLITQKVNNDVEVECLSTTDSINSHSYRGKDDYASNIYIETDPETGEFSALVPPIMYNVSNIVVKKTGEKVGDAQVIDLTNPILEFSDSLETGETFAYNASLVEVYHSAPVFNVADITNGEGAFGISEYEYSDLNGSFTIDDIYTKNGAGAYEYKYGAPLYVMQDKYKFSIEGYEEYVNPDGETPVISTVPLAGTVVTISNALSSSQMVAIEGGNYEGDEYKAGDVVELQDNQLELDNDGKATYVWKAGLPNITSPYTRTISMSYDIDGRQYNWIDGGMPGIILGELSTGNNFVTSGPDAVQMILRDPPGSGSHAEWTTGTVYAHHDLTGSQWSTETELNTKTNFGFKASIVAGAIAVGTIEESEVVDVLEIGAKVVGEGENSHSVDTETSISRTVSTSSESDFVGSQGDVFVGTATNIIFGKARQVGFTRTDASSDEVELTLQDVMTTGLTFGTGFAYTQYHIENVLLPNFDEMKKTLLQTVSEDVIDGYKNGSRKNDTGHMLYLTTLNSEDEGWGTNNHDSIAWPATHTKSLSMEGPSYCAFRPADSALADSCYQDSIYWINSQIESWKHWLAENEKDKVEAFKNRDTRLIQNLSFDSGVAQEFSTETDSTRNYTCDWSAGALAVIGDSWGLSLNKTGVECEIKTETGGQEHSEESRDTTYVTSFTYALEDGDTGDALTVDVLSSAWSPIFHTRGGQTCNPYEGAEYARYYEPYANHELNAATMQIEVPYIDVDQATMADIPSGTPANFTLRLTNGSETNDDVTYLLRMLDETNTNGAKITIDGQVLTEGRNIGVPAGTVITKALQLTQTNLSVLEYNNIGIVLSSVNQDDIADTVWISAQFVPSSSAVDLATSTSVVNMFTGTNLDLTFRNFDRSYYNLKAFRLQYKQEGDADWTQIREYVLDEQNLTSSNQMLPSSGSSVSYTLPMEQFSDGNYIFRVASVSTYGTGEVYRYSTEVPVVKDVARPSLLGSANPSTGILGAGDDISVRFNEDIRSGSLTKANNFSVIGVLNDADVDHEVALALTGAEAQAQTDVAIDLAGHDFSFGFWLNRLTDGTILSHGTSSNIFTVGTTDDGKLTVNVGGETFTSEAAIPADKWTYVALNYTQGTAINTINASAAYDATILQLFRDQAVPANASNGKLVVGSCITGSINELTLWNESQNCEDAIALRNKSKSASTKGLVGYWKMNEGHGTELTDAARSRSLLLASENWYINNINKAAHFDGTSRYATDLSKVSMLEDESYAVEMWVKPDELSDATFFQSGNGKVAVGMTSDGKLEVTTNAESYKTTATISEGAWHHVALNVLRGQSAILYVDGVNSLTLTEQSVPALQGDSLLIGASRFSDRFAETGRYHYGNNFKGDIDEVRVWCASLQGKYLIDSRYNRVDTATVKGLVAYYPMEHSHLDTNNQAVTEFSLANVMDDNASAQTAALPTEATAAPGLKSAPARTNLQYTFTASEREIFLNLTDAASRLEGTTVYFTLSNVRDLHENISVPIIWSAYIRQNPLVWDVESQTLTAEAGESTTFEATFTNNGGASQDWSLSGLPTWLTASQTQGTLEPMKTQTITFTTSSATPIGSYDETIYLVGNSAIDEPLEVNFKVTGNNPDWAVDFSQYDQTMSMTAQLFIKDVICENTDTRVSAFVGEECIGIAQPQYFPSRDSYYLCMSIYGNEDIIGKPVEFKVWDASTGIIYSDVDASQDITFSDGGIYGTFNKPVELRTTDVIEQQLALNKGWNWTSFYVQPQSPLVNDVLDDYAEYITIVKDRNSFAMSDGEFYEGSLATLTGAKLHMMYLTQALTLDVQGYPVAAADATQTVNKNWNWIGNPSQSILTLERAFAGLNPEVDDLVKSRTGFAIYNGSIWEGTLTSIEPGKGYLYHSEADATKTFNYPESTAGVKQRPSLYATTEENYFTVADMSDYPGNMTVVAEVYLGDERIDTLEVAVYAGEECRTSTKASNGRYYITIPGEGNGPSLEFYTYFDDSVYRLNPEITYTNDAILGSLSSPLKLTFDEAVDITGVKAASEDGSIYTITGIKVGGDKTDLPKGIYIQNGKKMLVK